MRLIVDDVEFLDISSVLDYLSVSKRTLQRYIKKGKLRIQNIHGGNYVSKNEVELLVHNSHTHQAIVTTKDVEQDIWLHTKQNLVRLLQWGTGKYITWGSLGLEDVKRYWQYIILPVWRQTQPITNQFPSSGWLVTHGFSGFKRSFEERYWEKNGIKTLHDFWKTL
jgi:hypothetical protein